MRRALLKALLKVAIFAAIALALTETAVVPREARAQSAKTTLKDPALATRFNEISDRLVCQCGCNMNLRVCNHQNCPSAIPMRRDIEKGILEGKDDDAIVAGFVEAHGVKVLSSPPAEGLNLAAWVMPGFAVLVGLLVIAYFATRWAAKRRLAVSPAHSIDPELRRRIEEELARGR